MRKHGDRDGTHCLKLQCPVQSSSAAAARPTVETTDASAVKLICLALYCARTCDGTKIREVLIRDLLFADYAALTTHQEDHLQSLMDRFSKACEDFRLTISLKKTNIMSRDTESPPSIAINNYQLEVVKEFTYLGSTVTDNLDMGLNSTDGLTGLHRYSPGSQSRFGRTTS